ncbi:MAG: GAF domain-containing protein, partial [Halobaculum sp.]
MADLPVDFFGPEATPRVETAIGQAVVDGETRVMAPLRTADGGEIPFEFTALLVDRGDSQAIVGSGRRIDGESDIERPARPPEERADLETQVTINRLFGSVVDAVLDAETRESTERAVCEALTGSDLFRFAWIGEYETDADRVEPRAWAGEGADYLDDRPNSTARTESQTTALEVVTSDEPRIVSDIGADRSASIWRAAALNHGHRSAVAVPISRGDTTYGSLSVYAGETDAFDDIDDGVFDRLGSLLGYAIRTTEIRRSLVADTAVQFQFQVTDPDAFLVSAARRTDGRLNLVDAVERPDGAIVQLFAVRGIPVDLLETLAAESPVPVDVIADRESEVLLRATIEGDSLA